jgi:hypothetical protein
MYDINTITVVKSHDNVCIYTLYRKVHFIMVADANNMF